MPTENYAGPIVAVLEKYGGSAPQTRPSLSLATRPFSSKALRTLLTAGCGILASLTISAKVVRLLSGP